MIKANTKPEDIKKGQAAWFHETFSNTIKSAIVREVSKSNVTLDIELGGTICIPTEYVFTDKKTAEAALRSFDKTSVKAMCDKIKSPEDLIKFLYNSNTSGEDADEHAREAARIKTKEFFNLDIEDDRYFAVTAINAETGKFRALYDFIKNPEDAYLLAQYAIQCNKRPNEIISIFPGRRINLTDELKQKAERLADKYKVD